MDIQSLAHCGLVVRDLEKSRWFYGTVLGMKEVPRPKTFKFGGAWFVSGAFEVHLVLAKDTVAPPGFRDAGAGARTGLATHLAFEVPDLDKVVATLEKHGVSIKGGPMARGDGVMQLYLHDPDGYLVEFFTWSEGSEIDAPERDAVLV
ncbi:MAG: VOC family protein [Ardenticatenaceae bacterium]